MAIYYMLKTKEILTERICVTQSMDRSSILYISQLKNLLSIECASKKGVIFYE